MLKSSADDDIVKARAAVRGQSFLYPAAVSTLIRDFVERSDTQAAYDPLTPRELEILNLIAEAQTSKEIAELLSSASRPSNDTALTSCTDSLCATTST